MIKTEQRLASFIKQGVKFITRLPDGWSEIKGALTAPSGYKWVHSFKGDIYQKALLEIK